MLIRSIKAIFTGSLFIFVAMLLLQLVALFAMVGFKALSKDYPFLIELGGVFRYLLGLPLFLLIMFVGGAITAYIAKAKVLLHCSIVGLLTTGAMFWWAAEDAALSNTGLIMMVLMILTSLIGGKFWQSRLSA